MDLFPKDWYAVKTVRRFEVAYVAESYSGDRLSFFKEQVGDEEYDIEVRKNVAEGQSVGEVVCRGKIIFRNK